MSIGTGRMPTVPVPQFVRWRLRGARGSGSAGDMELGRRGVVFDNRIIFDVSATSFDNLTFENRPRVIRTCTVNRVFNSVLSISLFVRLSVYLLICGSC